MTKKKLPAIRFDRLLSYRDRLRSSVASFIGTTIDHEKFTELCSALAEDLKTVKPTVLLESIRGVVGSVLSREEALQLADRLAGNSSLLVAGSPVYSWRPAKQVQWGLAQMTSVQRHRTKSKFGYMVAFDIWSGEAAGLSASRFVSSSLARLILMKCGYTSRKGKLPIADNSELFGLFVCVGILGEQEGKPNIDNFDSTPAVVKMNRERSIYLRRRVSPCPRKYLVFCHNCAKGSVSCDAATHRLDYRKQFCHGCCKQDQVFDLDLSLEYCRNCVVAKQLRLHSVGE